MPHISSTKSVPEVGAVPKHIAIIMDGDGRWAKQKGLSIDVGHQHGVLAVQEVVAASLQQGVEYLTLFAFPSENWDRPEAEVKSLLALFLNIFDDAVAQIHANGIRFKVVGDLEKFEPALQQKIAKAEERTVENDKLTVTFCANYDGRWDIVQALNRLRRQPDFELPVTEEKLAPFLSLSYAPEPDLLIRTGGSTKLSNFLLWQLAYSEMYFTDTLWPDFDTSALQKAIASYQTRERRFGRTSAQVQST